MRVLEEPRPNDRFYDQSSSKSYRLTQVKKIVNHDFQFIGSSLLSHVKGFGYFNG
jgi:hypothetical protein